ncbi:MAG TPA: ATP-binding protein [Gemmatimonadaceae bacterium]|nr:ATP-binding protein [Gemmatimonadaceae bacterium]
MHFEIPQAAVALSWSLQSALLAGLAVTSGVLAITFRRSVMWTLTATFLCATVASVLVWVSLTSASLGMPESTGVVFAAGAIALGPGAAAVLMTHMIRLLAGAAGGAWPRPQVLVGWSLAAAAASYVVSRVAYVEADAPIGVIGAFGSIVAFIVFFAIGVYALRLRARHPGRASVFRLFGAALIALAFRSIVNLVIAAVAVATGGTPTFPPFATGVQVFLLAVSGVLQLVAVLDEERALAVQQAEQLRNAQLALAASQRLESLGQMAGAVAHDFNNVLTVISVSSEAARATPGEAHDEELRDIHEAARRGQALTRQLVAFARSSPQVVARFDAAERTREMGVLLERMAGQQTELEVRASTDPQWVQMDVTQFEQVLMNLVANGRDAAAPGGHVRVEVGPGGDRPGGAPGDDQALVRLTVQDNGTGISPDVLPRIFEPFFSTKRAGEGSGLGLATCERIVRAAGGRIEVRSEPGQGARFDVLLPRAS